MAQKKHKKAAAKKVSTPAATQTAAPAFNVDDNVNYILNEDECAELECAPGTKLTALVMQVNNETGEHLIRFNFRPGQPRTKGAFVGNKPGNITA